MSQKLNITNPESEKVMNVVNLNNEAIKLKLDHQINAMELKHSFKVAEIEKGTPTRE